MLIKYNYNMNISEEAKRLIDDTFTEPFHEYAFEVISDIVLGVALGVIINMIVDYLGNLLGLPFSVKLLIQLTFIILILYFLKIDSNVLYSSWKGHTSYGIIFTSVFIAAQKNLIKFFQDVYDIV